MIRFRSVKPGVATDAKFRLLVNQSASGTKFHEVAGAALAGSNRSSKVATKTAAVDWRSIPESRRWNAPQLFEPGAALGIFQVPDWIYTSRDGTNPVTLTAASR